MDYCTREALAIEINTPLSSKRIISTLESVMLGKARLGVIRTDNGPEFSSKVLSGGTRNMKLRFNLFN